MLIFFVDEKKIVLCTTEINIETNYTLNVTELIKKKIHIQMYGKNVSLSITILYRANCRLVANSQALFFKYI